MNNKIKIAIASLCGVVVITMIVMYFTIRKLRKANQIQKVELITARDSAQVYRTKAGEAYFKLDAATIDANALKGSLKALGIENKELRAMDIKRRDLIAVLRAELSVAGRDSIVYLPGDTVKVVDDVLLKGKKYEWSNSSLSIWGVAWPSYMDNNYSYKVKMEFFTDKQGRDTRVTVKLSDKQAVITTGSSIVIQNKTKWYQKPWLWGLAGLGLGIYIAK